MLKIEKKKETRTGRRTSQPSGLYRKALSENISDVAQEIIGLLGPTVTASLSGISDRKQPQRWAQGLSIPRDETENKLRLAYRIILFLRETENDHIIRSWFIGSNPSLNEDTPVTGIRAGNVREVLAAAQHFIEE